MKKVTILALSLLAAILIQSCSSMSPKGPLQLNLEKGLTRKIKSETDIQYFSDATLSEKVMSMNMEMTIDYTVTDKSSEGIQTIEAKVSSIKLDQSMSGMNITYNSEDEAAAEGMGAMVAQQFEPILNKFTTFQLDKTGTFVEDSTKSEDEAMSPATFMKQAFSKLPEGNIKVGESWTQDQGTGANSEGMKATYTVASADKKEVTYTFTLEDMDMEEVDEELKDTDIKASGTVVYDRKSGELLSNVSNSTFKGSNPQMGDFFVVSSSKVSAVK